jgi:Right handed beta helix region
LAARDESGKVGTPEQPNRITPQSHAKQFDWTSRPPSLQILRAQEVFYALLLFRPDQIMKTKTHLSIVVCFLCVTPSAFGQGALTPPGPPAPAMKSLAQIEPRAPISSLPFSINGSGSYYLTTNLVTTSGSISIFAENVTLDLNGFTIDGSSNAPFAIVGYSCNNLTVRNGTFRGFATGGTAVDGRTAACRFENVQLAVNNGVGLWCGAGSTFLNCTFSSNSPAQTIYAPGGGCVMENCIFVGNATPMQLGAGSVVSSCTLSNNSGTASLGAGCKISGCTMVGNNNTGLVTGDGCVVLDCVARGNSFYGLAMGNGCTIKDCIAQQNAQRGISCKSNCIVSACLIVSNGNIGMFADLGSTVNGCISKDNTGDGIQITDRCLVTGNYCDHNSSSGIHALGGSNRIQGNSFIANVQNGLKADGIANLVIQNSARGNGTNYNLVANNNVGPIVLAPASGAIAGSTGGAGVGTTDPWANFSY